MFEICKSRGILHLDATGAIIRQSNNIKNQLMLCSAVVMPDEAINRSNAVQPIADALNERKRFEDISHWLLCLANDLARISN